MGAAFCPTSAATVPSCNIARMEIRIATTADIDAVLVFWRDATDPSSTDDAASLAALLARFPDAMVLAVDQEVIVGTVIVGWDGWRGAMYRIAVAPADRRRDRDQLGRRGRTATARVRSETPAHDRRPRRRSTAWVLDRRRLRTHRGTPLRQGPRLAGSGSVQQELFDVACRLVGMRRILVVALIFVGACAGGSKHTAPRPTTAPTPAEQARKLCRASIPKSEELFSSAPTTVGVVRATTIATIGPGQTHSFPTLGREHFAGVVLDPQRRRFHRLQSRGRRTRSRSHTYKASIRRPRTGRPAIP